MVGAVKKWQKSDPQKSLDTWRRLSEANSALEIQLNLLSKLAKEQWDAYKSVIDSCSKLRSDKVIVEVVCGCLINGSNFKIEIFILVEVE